MDSRRAIDAHSSRALSPRDLDPTAPRRNGKDVSGVRLRVRRSQAQAAGLRKGTDMELGKGKGAGRGGWRRAKSAAARCVLAVALAGASAGLAHADVASTVDLNTASVADLAALPGIGESKARAIVAYRDATPFRSVDELRDVKGIGDKMLEKLREHITVSQVGGGAAKQRAAETEQGASGAASAARTAAQAAQSNRAATAR